MRIDGTLFHFFLVTPVLLLGQTKIQSQLKFFIGNTTWWSQWTQLVLVKAAAANFYVLCTFHRDWICSLLLGPPDVPELRFYLGFNFPAVEVNIISWKWWWAGSKNRWPCYLLVRIYDAERSMFPDRPLPSQLLGKRQLQQSQLLRFLLSSASLAE